MVVASELPPTFGVPDTKVIGIIAGGDRALRHAVERAEDISEQGWKDLQAHTPTANDTVLGIAASGTTPYVLGAVKLAKENGLLTGAQKMVLNMISTTLMIRMGRVQGNRMVNMQLTNAKLVDRGTRMLQDMLGIDYDEAQQRLLKAGSVDKARSDKTSR